MNSTPATESTKTTIKDYAKYAATGAIIHPLLAGFVSAIFAAFDFFTNKDEMTTFFGLLFVGVGFFPLLLAMFVIAGVFYSVAFGLVYNNTFGKAVSSSKKFLYNILFSILAAIISPIVVYILLTIFYHST
ncbi:MAG: hypothetical protein JNJ43_06135 [Anaerolineales bacterium]|nr:hypothetical protein [Anaerolineales bacterium]